MSKPSPRERAQSADRRGAVPEVDGLVFRTDLNQTEFEIQFYDAVLARSPNYVEVLRRMGTLLTQEGYYIRGLEIDQRLARLCPRDCIVHYNLACSLALVSRKQEALAQLRRAIELGYDDFAHMEMDADLDNLRTEPAFQALLRPGGAGTA